MFNLELAITEWRRQMTVGGLKSSKALGELENHLRDAVEQGIRSGLGAEPAFNRAVQQLGGVAALQAEFAKAARQRRRNYLVRAIVIGLGLFVLGAVISRVALLPSMTAVSQKYFQWNRFQISGEVDVAARRHFVNKLTLGTGLAFEIPLVILALVKIGVLNYRALSKARRYAIVINLILGALITTPEVFTQILMFLPLQTLYELTVWVARFWECREMRRA